MAVLDPKLELLLAYEPPRRRVQAMLDWDGDAAVLASLGVTLLAPIESGTALVELPLSTADALRAEASIGYIQLLPSFVRELDVSRKVVATPKQVVPTGAVVNFSGLTGMGVIVGIIDGELDVFHKSLRRPDDTTRFLAVWDMNPNGKTASVDRLRPPKGFNGRGLLYSKADIDVALSKPSASETKEQRDRRRKLADNLKMLRSKGHGTRVASIAAGNGRQQEPAIYGPYLGIAPEADLIGVVVRSPSDWAIAMRYLGLAIDTKPGVINLSAGEHHGPHLPGGRVERWFETFITDSGIPVVKSAGNTGDRDGHATGVIKKSQGVSLQVVMSTAAGKLTERIHLEVWYGYGGADPKLGATIAPPGGPVYDIPYGGVCTAPPRLIGARNHKLPEHAGLSVVMLSVKPVVGTWTIRLTAPKDADVTWHAWVTWIASRTGCITLGPKGLLSSASTTTVPTAVANMVTVASFVTKDKTDQPTTPPYLIARSSARGPAADGSTRTLTIAAPGEYIKAAVPPAKPKTGDPPSHDDRYDLDAGTSFAAPHVTGAIALMLQKNPLLTPAEIVAILKTKDPGEVLDEDTWGSGRLNITNALDKVEAP